MRHPKLGSAAGLLTVAILAFAFVAPGAPFASEDARPAQGVMADTAPDEQPGADSGAGCLYGCANLALQMSGARVPTSLAPAPGFSVIGTGFAGAEPTIGVSDDGTKVYIQAGLNTIRSTNSGTSWLEIGPLATNVATFDPMLYFDPVINRLYVNQLTVECSVLAWADSPDTISSGPTALWKVNPHACGLPGIDHQKLEGGPDPLLGAANSGRAVYMGYSQAGGGAMVARSIDGGFTWINAVAANSVSRGTVLWPTGPVTADPAGSHVYLPMHNPSVGLRVSVSHNSGLNYVVRTVTTGFGSSGHAVDPEVAVDESGTAYVVWYNQSNHTIYYAYSTDNGDTWQGIRKVSANDILSTVFPTVVAKSDGKLNVAFYGTKNSTAGPDNCGTACKWYVFNAQIVDADTANPTITTTQITPYADPIQIGKICTEGTGCATGTRGLLDFIDIEVDASGYAHIAYTDGCFFPCGPTSTSQSTGNLARYARQTSGDTI